MDKNGELTATLSGIVHPESGKDIVSAGIVEKSVVKGNKVGVVLSFARRHDPFAASLKRQVESAIAKLWPQAEVNVEITAKASGSRKAGDGSSSTPHGTAVSTMQDESTPPRQASSPQNDSKSQNDEPAQQNALEHVCRKIAVASGKGGVGKSTVTANLSLALHSLGYSVGVLDADIYGPSQPRMFGVADHKPQVFEREGQEWIIPASSHGVKIASIGLFIPEGEALVWRGPMAVGALKQLIHQTLWGELDYLLIDLPPGTGDVHLSIASELRLDGALIVSTPQRVALDDVRRGIKMFRSPGIDVPIIGIIENMAWFTPAELPDNRYYIFGRGGARSLASAENIDFLGEIPLIQSVMESAEAGIPITAGDSAAAGHYVDIARKIVEKLPADC